MQLMSREKSFMVICVIAVLSLGILFGCNKRSSSSRVQNYVSTPLPVMVEELKKTPKITPRISLVICPFTNSNHEITADALQFYFPTVFKASWTPTRIYNAPFDSFVYISANNGGLFTPGKQFPQEMALSFANIFGTKNYVTVMIDKQTSGYRATLSMVRDNNAPVQKELVITENETPLLPGKIAITILEFAVPDKVNEEIRKYVQRPAADNPETLRKTVDQLLSYYTAQMNFSNAEVKHMIDTDANLDWLIPIYINMVSYRNLKKAVDFAQDFALEKSENPRFQMIYAGMLANNGDNAKAIDAIQNVIVTDPDNTKARMILAQAVEQMNKSIEADPYFQTLLNLEPDSAWTNLIVGVHKIDLAWQHRGSGWAYTVSREGWRNFDKELNAANEYLHRSITLDPYQIDAYTKLITVGMGLNLDKGEVREYFKRAQAIDQDNMDPYSRYQEYLKPKWHGSMEELREFWAETATRKLQNPDIYLLPVDAHMEFGARYAYDEENNKRDSKKFSEYYSNPEVWNDIHQAYEQYFTYRMDNRQAHGIFAYIASYSHQPEVAFDQFELAGLNYKGTNWLSYENYLRAYCFMAKDTNHLDRLEEVAQTGLKFNHCEGCNQTFQEYLNYAREHK